MRILIVDDDLKISGFLKSNLEAEYFAVDVASDGEAGSFLARTNDYDLIILDNELPKKNGAQVCKEIRQVKKDVKIIMLSVLAEIPIKVDLFNFGVDDYMTKPFSFAELLVRIKALGRRPGNFVDDVIRIDDLILDIGNGTLSRNDKEIKLTRKQFMLLAFLAKNAGKTLSQGEIVEHVWDMKLDSFSGVLKSHIMNLRRKIDVGREKSLIQTVSGRGYKII